MSIERFQDLVVWQRSIELVEEVYEITKHLPSDEKFGLISQIRRVAVSIPSNIAEGQRRGTKDFRRFLIIANGSAAEVETQLVLIERLFPHVNCSTCNDYLLEIRKMLFTLINKLNKI